LKKYAVIVAGGAGHRMGGPVPKQFLVLNGKPVLWYTVSTFLEAYPDLHIILVLPESHLSTGHEIAGTDIEKDRIQFVKGGENRFESVKTGLKHVPDEAIVFIHDGVRCLVTVQLIRKCYEQTLLTGSAVPAIAPPDSIRQLTPEGSRVIDRNNIRLIQTPQTFRSTLIKKAYDQKYDTRFSDEATVFESNGHSINLIPGEVTNLKITFPIDLQLAVKILESRALNYRN
jgi:2-C-methyl-D-erythritol 4-phosphate cytidylyltransferase